MKTQYYTATSLDGYIADPHNSLDWLFQFGDPEDSSYPEFIKDVGALAMGSTTYQWLLDNHLRPGTENAQPWSYTQPSWIFTSRTLTPIEGADIRFVRGDVRPVHEEMVAAANGKNVWIVGGGELAGQFYDHGLLDELIVTIAPVTLGSGAPLLPRAITKPPLKQTAMTQYGPFIELRFDIPK